uniref:Uncharacterized protein n=1 Tax=Rhizophora mucronata TaxID=61149 RepID=A0A2P2ND37_RHIMU
MQKHLQEKQNSPVFVQILSPPRSKLWDKTAQVDNHYTYVIRGASLQRQLREHFTSRNWLWPVHANA